MNSKIKKAVMIMLSLAMALGLIVTPSVSSAAIHGGFGGHGFHGGMGHGFHHGFGRGFGGLGLGGALALDNAFLSGGELLGAAALGWGGAFPGYGLGVGYPGYGAGCGGAFVAPYATAYTGATCGYGINGAVLIDQGSRLFDGNGGRYIF